MLAGLMLTFQQKTKSPWASNLPIFVFTYLLDEGYKQLANINEAKEMTWSYFTFSLRDKLCTGMLRKNLKDIKDTFIRKRCLKSILPKMDLKIIIARGILIHPDLVNL